MAEKNLKDPQEYEFLRDQPLQTEEELNTMEFGHKEIAKTLVKIISRCPTPFTVGLFGKWGSGKSTIAYSLKKDLQPKKIPVVIFDVWKHEGDALRRTFLKEMCNQLESYGEDYFEDYKLNDRLEHSVSKTSDGKFKINWNKIREISKIWIFGGITLILVLVASSIKYGVFNQFLYGFSILIAISLGGSFITWLLQNATQFLTAETTTYGTDKFKDPYKFEDEFSNIIKKLKNKRILIVFDNMDRVAHDKAINVLTTIKTFLEPKDIEITDKEAVFLIPCDSEAIKKHIESFYSDNNNVTVFDSDEFLRKFFNTVLWIPDFISSELEVYTKKVLRATKVKELDNDKVAWIITKTFRQNPRQIKQFVNILLANYLLIKEREGNEMDFPVDFLSNNLPQLAKYLILNQVYPNEMNKLREEKILNLEKVIDKIELPDTKRKNQFIEFVKETSLIIPLTNLRIFFTLRRSEQEKKFAGIETFFEFLEDNQIRDAEEYLKQLDNLSEDGEDFSHVIKEELKRKIDPISISNFVKSLLTILDKSNIKLAETAYEDIYNKYSGIKIEYSCTVSPSVIDNQLLTRSSRYRKKIVTQWLEILSNKNPEEERSLCSDAFSKEVLNIFFKNHDYLTKEQVKRLRVILNDKFTEPWEIPDFLANWDHEIQKKYLSHDYLANYISKINTKDIENKTLPQKISTLVKFSPDLFTESILGMLMKKLIELQTYENSKPANPDREEIKKQLMEGFRSILNKLIIPLNQIKDKTNLTTFTGLLINASNAFSNWDERKIFILVYLELEKIIEDTKSSAIKQQTNNFFASAKQENIEYVLNYIENKWEFVENSTYYKVIEQRALNNQEFFNYCYNKLSDRKKTELLIKLLGAYPDKAIATIEVTEYRVPNPIFIVKKILEVVDSISVSEKQRFFKACNVLKCGNDTTLRDLFVEKIKKLLKSTDNQSQQTGLIAFSEAKRIGKTRIRLLVKDIFDWIRKPDIVDKYQPPLIKAIFLGYAHFNKEEQGEYLQFVFDDLVRKATKIEQVSFGFELLKEIQPKYEERKRNFDDVKIRIDSEQDNTLKIELVHGLIGLKPKRVNMNNRDYWEWVDVQAKNLESEA